MPLPSNGFDFPDVKAEFAANSKPATDDLKAYLTAAFGG